MRNGKWTVWALFTWFLSGVLLAFFNRPFEDKLWVLTGVVYLAFVLAGIVLLGAASVSTYRKRSVFAFSAIVGFLLFGSILFFASPSISSAGDDLVVRYRFRRNAAEYDRIVAQARDGALAAPQGEMNGVHYVIDNGPPIRVAFPQPGGLLDNWEGIVYDPTGEVLKARGWAVDGTTFSAPSEIVGLFGGDIVTCSHLNGNYYRCRFT